MAIRVLVADDSEFMRSMLQDILWEAGYEIADVARDGEEAIEKYFRHKPDLVTLDTGMPKVKGFEALDRIRAKDPEAKVVIVSSEGRTGNTAEEAMRRGAKAVITKPFRPAEVLGILKDVISKHHQKV